MALTELAKAEVNNFERGGARRCGYKNQGLYDIIKCEWRKA